MHSFTCHCEEIGWLFSLQRKANKYFKEGNAIIRFKQLQDHASYWLENGL